MKTTSLLLAGLLSVMGASAFAQGSPVSEVKADNAAVRHETREIQADRRAVHHDNVAIAVEKRDIAHDKNVATIEQHDAPRAQHREDALIAKGDLADAQKVDKVRHHELNEAKIARRDASHDRRVIAIEKRKRAHTIDAVADEHAERRTALAKRNHDAAELH